MHTRDLAIWVGLALGLAATMFGVASFGAKDQVYLEDADDSVVALVNGVPVDSARYYRALANLTTASRGPELSASLRKSVVDDLVAEELLIEHAVELGLAQREPMARRHLLKAAIDIAQSDAPTWTPSEKELRSYFEKHQQLFPGQPLYRVSTLFFASESQEQPVRVKSVVTAIKAGEPMSSFEKLADKPTMSLPAQPVSEKTLRHVLGPTATKTVIDLEEGQVSPAVRVAGGYRILALHGRSNAEPLRFEEARSGVLALMRGERAARARQQYVESLKDSALIQINADLINNESPIPTRYLEEAQVPSSPGDR
jgi:hypothetical protein